MSSNIAWLDPTHTQIKGVSKVYPSAFGAKVAVKATSLGIPKGQCFGLLGINGAGKSSLLSILSGKCLLCCILRGRTKGCTHILSL